MKSGRKSLENLSIWKVLIKALCQRNYWKSVISLISLKSVISMKSGDFIILVNQTVWGSLLKFVARNPLKSVHLTLNGIAFDWKNWYFSPKVCISFETKQEITWNLLFLWFHWNLVIWWKSPKLVNFLKIYNFPCNDTER